MVQASTIHKNITEIENIKIGADHQSIIKENPTRIIGTIMLTITMIIITERILMKLMVGIINNQIEEMWFMIKDKDHGLWSSKKRNKRFISMDF